MSDKVEWEVVDETTTKPGAAPEPGPAIKNMLGPWWRLKLAALAALGTIGLVLMVALAGVVVVSVAAVALLSFVIARLAQWMRGDRPGTLAVHRHRH
ncbi:MAG TPA: hypothetical protein VIM12_01730 [Noviherbaspirillum sp.]|jgi:hypothetical protein|uniref:hypothetical protein n=1 Tax=Noviherbaspirillum sp. TaxID=1926288 RepID=UPI002F91CBD9